ncbi:MAG TPA: DNA (cytosine-5-)-methyltransferase [Cyanobacteria bacterium UBA11149]|nr:DNA (cytosine-5-)-methyltransferase [Cyanobacteria bacterium UBA11367]HBE59543.1 DNA (cytosine-5-)-methyltransferase [Cyanobacteria bacterium UBA11366]HBK63859.1 DNA (cytosine-5-)-methyltransferase [Cyanobacteria bacterium UBA11166]HBR75576.1 DNA (cytosine-5-)-methyltransferase [Cyanobacteria bacterium UBA11159]HBS68583.1 DNA (cytosine-5-)-methyltransferase [Cyanobacteria bacterium UBA11153]HBW87417.1 DNA (cytosine-5-)-methyltransferase [Cyanobacteria bacterium UBA11149]HCA93495.1 DNA (cyt
MVRTEKPIAIDLFAGAGGFGLGFEMAGFSVPLSVEIDAWACDTLRYNHSNMTVIQGDIRQFNTESNVREICLFQPEIIIGGPPCQGFSIAGPAQKDPQDPRNTLFINFAQWIEFLQPKAFVMENVKGLKTRRNTEDIKVIDIIKQTFQNLGYFVEIWILKAAEYGVPQIRERIFIVGNKLGKALGIPRKTHSLELLFSRQTQLSFFQDTDILPALTLWDAISDLPPLNPGEGSEEQPYILEPQNDYQNWIKNGDGTLYNHVAMDHSQRLVERFKHIKWGESSSDVPKEYRARRRSGNGELSDKSYDQNNRRLNPYQPSHTIAASFYANFLHPFQHRNLTAREGARIQSFPDSYRFLGKKTVVSHKLLHREGRLDEKFLCQYNQVGNAIPPLLAKAIALHLKEKLNLCP